jgi:hypothetical protein
MNDVLRPAGVIAAVVALATVLALLLAPEPATSPDEDDVAPPGEDAQVVVDAQAGAWYCPAEVATAGDDDTSRVVAVRPAVDGRPARFTTRLIGELGIVQLGEVFPGAGQLVTGGLEDALEVRWTDLPVTVSRVSAIAAEPAGVLARPCVSQVASSWTLPGMTTAAGATVSVRLTNPLAQEAAVAIRGLTPQGEEAPIVLQNISVPSGETVDVDLAEYLPQQPDLALDIQARSGRVVVDAVLESVPTVSGVQGRTPLVATSDRETRWFLPWVATVGQVDGRGSGPVDDEPGATASPSPTATAEATATPEPTEEATPAADASDAVEDILDVVVEGEATPSSWIWLANPAEEDVANVQVSFLTSEGRIPATVLGTVEVSPGSVRRLVLDDVLPDVAGDVGVDVQVTNDVPIAVAGGVVVDDGSTAARTGIAVLDAVAFDDSVVSMTTLSAPDREQWVTLANPFGVRAVVDLRIWNGTTSQSPAELQGLLLEPGESRSIEMTPWASGDSEFTVFAVASEGSLTGMVRGLAPEGPLLFSATSGIPLAIWTADGSLVTVARQQGLVNRLGTDLGLPLEVPTPISTPEPLPDVDGTLPATPDESSATPSQPATPATPTSSATGPTPTPTSTSASSPPSPSASPSGSPSPAP